MGLGGNAEFTTVHTKIMERKRRKEQNIFTNLNSARQGFLLMNEERFLSYLEYIFIYFAGVTPFRSLQMAFLRHTVNGRG